MFANAYQSGCISIFYSCGSNPLALWDKQVKNGHIRRVVDEEVKSLVLEVAGTNVATTYITCPIKPKASLGIKLPFLVMIIKNMKKYFTFEIQILDDKDMHRRFRVSNFQSTTKVKPFCTTMPIGLSSGWNQVQFNLADFTKRAYGSTYMETTRVQIHANVRIRRIYLSDVLYGEEEMPNEFKLFAPPQKKAGPPSRDSKVKAAKETPVEVEEKFQFEKIEGVLEEVPPPPSPAEEVLLAVVEEVPVTAEGKVPAPTAETSSGTKLEEEIPAVEAELEATKETAEADEAQAVTQEVPEGAEVGAEEAPVAAAEEQPPAEAEGEAKTEADASVPAEEAAVAGETATEEQIDTEQPAAGDEQPAEEPAKEPAAAEEPATAEEPASPEPAAAPDEVATTEEPPEGDEAAEPVDSPNEP